jgi:hypothetical protein
VIEAIRGKSYHGDIAIDDLGRGMRMLRRI